VSVKVKNSRSYKKGIADMYVAIRQSFQCWGMGGDEQLGHDERQPIWRHFNDDLEMQLVELVESGPLEEDTLADADFAIAEYKNREKRREEKKS
jgi:hypothetical protein